MPDTHDDCMTIVANARRRQKLVTQHARALRVAESCDEAVEIHTAMMLEIGFVQSDLCKLEAWLRAARACQLEAPHTLPVPAVSMPLADAAIDRLEQRDHPELPLRVVTRRELPAMNARLRPRDCKRAAANDHDDDEEGES